VRADDLAVLEGKRVERSAELLVRQDERRCQSLAIPSTRQARARLEIRDGQRIDQCEAGQWNVSVLFDPGAVGHHGSKPRCEDVLEVGDQRSGQMPPRRCHEAILAGMF
jgi:hypothetical protein